MKVRREEKYKTTENIDSENKEKWSLIQVEILESVLLL